MRRDREKLKGKTKDIESTDARGRPDLTPGNRVEGELEDNG